MLALVSESRTWSQGTSAPNRTPSCVAQTKCARVGSPPDSGKTCRRSVTRARSVTMSRCPCEARRRRGDHRPNEQFSATSIVEKRADSARSAREWVPRVCAWTSPLTRTRDTPTAVEARNGDQHDGSLAN